MENYKSKIVTAEAAVAAAVKDGDWVDYGFGGGFPELLDIFKQLQKCFYYKWVKNRTNIS